MGRGPEQVFHKRNKNGQQVYEEMFSVSSHQGNSDQNHRELLSQLERLLTKKDKT